MPDFGKKGKPKTREKEKPDVETVESVVEERSITPFSDGVVSPQFRRFPTVQRAADAEVALLKSFLHYFSVGRTFVGTIHTKTSFMKKKGGRLL